MIRPETDLSSKSESDEDDSDSSDNDCQDSAMALPQNKRMLLAHPAASVTSGLRNSPTSSSLSDSTRSGLTRYDAGSTRSGFSATSKTARSSEGSRIAKMHPWQMKGKQAVAHGANDVAPSHIGLSVKGIEGTRPHIAAPQTSHPTDILERQRAPIGPMGGSFHTAGRKLSNPDQPSLQKNPANLGPRVSLDYKQSASTSLLLPGNRPSTQPRSIFNSFADYMLGSIENTEEEPPFFRTGANITDSSVRSATPGAKAPASAHTLASLFRLKEEEVNDNLQDGIIKESIESARKSRHVHKTSFEIDKPRRPMDKNPIISPHVNKNSKWMKAKVGQELDNKSDSEDSESESDGSGWSINDYNGTRGDYTKAIHVDDNREAESQHSESMEESDSGLHSSFLRREALEELQDCDHAEAVLNTFQDLLDQAEKEERERLYAIDLRIEMGSLPSLVSANPSIDSLSDHEDDFSEDGKALVEFIEVLVEDFEEGLKKPTSKNVFDLFQWSEKKAASKSEPEQEKVGMKVDRNIIVGDKCPRGRGLQAYPIALSTEPYEQNLLDSSIESEDIFDGSRGENIRITRSVSIPLEDTYPNLEQKKEDKQGDFPPRFVATSTFDSPVIAVDSATPSWKLENVARKDTKITEGRRSMKGHSAEQSLPLTAQKELKSRAVYSSSFIQEHQMGSPYKATEENVSDHKSKMSKSRAVTVEKRLISRSGERSSLQHDEAHGASKVISPRGKMKSSIRPCESQIYQNHKATLMPTPNVLSEAATSSTLPFTTQPTPDEGPHRENTVACEFARPSGLMTSLLQVTDVTHELNGSEAAHEEDEGKGRSTSEALQCTSESSVGNEAIRELSVMELSSMKMVSTKIDYAAGNKILDKHLDLNCERIAMLHGKIPSSGKESEGRRKKEKTRIHDNSIDTNEIAGPPISAETKNVSQDETEESSKRDYTYQMEGDSSLKTKTQNLVPIVRREDGKIKKVSKKKKTKEKEKRTKTGNGIKEDKRIMDDKNTGIMVPFAGDELIVTDAPRQSERKKKSKSTYDNPLAHIKNRDTMTTTSSANNPSDFLRECEKPLHTVVGPAWAAPEPETTLKNSPPHSISSSKTEKGRAKGKRSNANSLPRTMDEAQFHDRKIHAPPTDSNDAKYSRKVKSTPSVGKKEENNLVTKSRSSDRSGHRVPLPKQHSEDSIDFSAPVFRKAPSRKNKSDVSASSCLVENGDENVKGLAIN